MAYLPNFTEKIRKQILSQNEGFTGSTSYSSKNLKFTNTYTVRDGSVYRRETGKTSWADSKFDNEILCDKEQTLRFLHKFWPKMNMKGILKDE